MPDLRREARADRGKLEIALLKREKYGHRSERAARLIDQMELQLEELESAASEDAIRAEKTTKVKSFERRKPVQDVSRATPVGARVALPRERVVIEAPKAIDDLLSSDHWPSFKPERYGSTAFSLEDGRVCLTNNCAERSLRGVALGRRSWLFAGSERGGHRAAFMYSLIGSAKLNGVDPQAWLADVIAWISDLPVSRLPELLPWNWQQSAVQPEKAA